MVNKKLAVFVKVSPGKMKVLGRIYNQHEQVIGDYEKIHGLPGFHFIGYKDEIDRAIEKATREEQNITVVSKDTEDLEITVQTSKRESKEKESKKDPEVGFSPERLKELKSIKPGEWVKKKKVEFIEVLKEGNIDFSAVKDDRMALYKFLIGILEEL